MGKIINQRVDRVTTHEGKVVSIYMPSMICGKRKTPNKVKNVPNDSKTKLETPKRIAMTLGKDGHRFPTQNQCTTMVKELLVVLQPITPYSYKTNSNNNWYEVLIC
jgi:hypothetical protein